MDRISRRQRSELMRRIVGDSLKPETLLKAALRRSGARFDSNPKDLPGKPDIALRGRKLAVFVHGCFWHACAAHYRAPKTNRQFWSRKIEANAKRDSRAIRGLNRRGWATMTVWEHDVRRSPQDCARRVLTRLSRLPKAFL